MQKKPLNPTAKFAVAFVTLGALALGGAVATVVSLETHGPREFTTTSVDR